MNLIEKYAAEAAKLSIRQYCPPRCFELAGKKLELVLDTNEETGDFILDFKDNDTLEWSFKGSPLKAEKYELRKTDDLIYLLSFNVAGKEPRENLTFVLDLEQMLVTYLRCSLGENPYYPYLIESHWGFGYIAEKGKKHEDRRRHGFTGDVVGTAVKWTYGHNTSTTHIYHDPHWYRIGYPAGEKKKRTGTSAMGEIMKKLPSADEPAYYVKIKEGVYLVSITEQNIEKILGDGFMGFRSDTLCFLDNYNHLYSVGRGFGTVTTKGVDRELFVMIGKYGQPVEVDESLFTDPIPYLV